MSFFSRDLNLNLNKDVEDINIILYDHKIKIDKQKLFAFLKTLEEKND